MGGAPRGGCASTSSICSSSGIARAIRSAAANSPSSDPNGRAPRSNLWSLSVPLLVLADALGVVSCPGGVLESVADRLDRDSAACGPGVETYDNPAKRLALDLAGKLPLVWGSTDLAGAAAYRLACQLAENAKYPSVAGTLPEAHHNQVVAFAGAFGASATDRHDTGDDIFRDRVEDAARWPRLRLVLLRDTDELPELARRREATIRLAEEHGVGVQEVAASGEHPLERLASLVGPTDLASVYLALALGMDPTPVEPITTLKERTRT